MPKQNAPIKSTSGEGFGFEDKVVSFFLCHLLAGTLPFGADFGRLVRLDCQVKTQGWELDDLLLTFNHNGRQKRCAFSVKSNRQFSGTTAPSDLVETCWAQYSRSHSQVFDPERDHFGIITSIQPPELRENLNTLLKLACGQSPQSLDDHVKTAGSVSEDTLKLYNSFECPGALITGIATPQPGMILSRFVFREFDFAEAISERESTSLGICENALLEGDLNVARSLWEGLLALAHKTRTRGGYLDLGGVLSAVRSRFVLKIHPDFEPDWRTMVTRTNRRLQLINCQLGGTLNVRRPKQSEELKTELTKSNIVLVRGTSGSGKSVLVKSYVEGGSAPKQNIIWIAAEELQRLEDKSLAEFLGLTRPLDEFLNSDPSHNSILIVDALEHCHSKEAYSGLRELISASKAETTDSPWKIIFTCQDEEWSRVQLNLVNFIGPQFAKVSQVVVGNFTSDQFKLVVSSFPSLRPLVLRKEIAKLLLRPKIIDLLVTHNKVESAMQVTAKWVGEADLIEWWWTDVIEQRQAASNRARVVRTLAEKLTDNLVSETSIDSLSGGEDVCSALVRDGICQIEEGRIRFAHDLFGDWARQRQLLVHLPDLKAYLSARLDIPMWQKALRLTGLHLLERRTDVSDWQNAFNQFVDETHTSRLARDLLLEATVFAADPEPLLEKLWPELAINDGALLTRLLNRFLHAATIPDWRQVEFFEKENPKLLTEVAARFRLPYFPYWPPVLNWLLTRTSDVIRLSGEEVAKICKLWLMLADGQFLDRTQAAELAVANAERIAPMEFSRNECLEEDSAREIYAAALASANDLPERVAKLALTLAGRAPLIPEQIPEDADAHSLGEESPLSGQVTYSELADDPPESWPDGPHRPVSHAFQRAFLQDNAGLSLIQAQPEVAAEVTLGLILAWPRTRIVVRREFGPSTLTERHGFQYLHPEVSFYTAPPFLVFLRCNPQQAISLILKLVNFATERCVDLHFNGDTKNAEVRITTATGEQSWVGDWRVYFWFRYPLITVHIVGAALMALEKWFYEMIESDVSIDGDIQTILAGTKSVAFAGLLICVGKKKPSLLTGPLKDLLTAREFHLWEDVQSAQYKHINAVGGFGESQLLRKWKIEWEQMLHRQISLDYLCRRLFVTTAELRPVFERIASFWAERAAEQNSGSDDSVSWLRWAAKYNIDNWKKVENEGQNSWQFDMPEHLQDVQAERDFQGERLLMHLPFWCAEVLQKQQRLTEDELESLWETLTTVSGGTAPDGDDEAADQFTHSQHSVAGIISVLVVLNHQWLKQHTDREKWCKNKIAELLQKPPPLHVYSTHEPVNTQFDGFMATVIPIFWTEEPNSPFWRQQIASFSLSPRLKTVATLCQAAAAQRAKLGIAFKELQTFFLHLSVGRLKARRQQYREKMDFDWPAFVSEWATRFIERTLPEAPNSWTEIAAPPIQEANRFNRDEHDIARFDEDVDLDFLLHAFSWIGKVDTAMSERERSDWIKFEREALNCVLRTFPRDVDQNREYGGTPYETDRAIFNRIAILLPLLRSEEAPDEFWKPILNLSSAAHYWVSDFLNSFLSQGLTTVPPSPAFVLLWQSMVDYAFKAPEWSRGFRYRLDEVWHHLLGLDWVIRSLWTKELESLVLEMKPYFERWAKERLDDENDLRALFSFLETPAAMFLVCDALEWINPILHQDNDWFWHRGEDRNAFASFLVFVWDNQWAEVKKRPLALQGFRTLAAKLASYQHPLALEISSQLSNVPLN